VAVLQAAAQEQMRKADALRFEWSPSTSAALASLHDVQLRNTSAVEHMLEDGDFASDDDLEELDGMAATEVLSDVGTLEAYLEQQQLSRMALARLAAFAFAEDRGWSMSSESRRALRTSQHAVLGLRPEFVDELLHAPPNSPRDLLCSPSAPPTSPQAQPTLTSPAPPGLLPRTISEQAPPPIHYQSRPTYNPATLARQPGTSSASMVGHGPEAPTVAAPVALRFPPRPSPIIFTPGMDEFAIARAQARAALALGVPASADEAASQQAFVPVSRTSQSMPLSSSENPSRGDSESTMSASLPGQILADIPAPRPKVSVGGPGLSPKLSRGRRGSPPASPAVGRALAAAPEQAPAPSGDSDPVVVNRAAIERAKLADGLWI
jgi:hypothetical protein